MGHSGDRRALAERECELALDRGIDVCRKPEYPRQSGIAFGDVANSFVRNYRDPAVVAISSSRRFSVKPCRSAKSPAMCS